MNGACPGRSSVPCPGRFPPRHHTPEKRTHRTSYRTKILCVRTLRSLWDPPRLDPRHGAPPCRPSRQDLSDYCVMLNPSKAAYPTESEYVHWNSPTAMGRPSKSLCVLGLPGMSIQVIPSALTLKKKVLP